MRLSSGEKLLINGYFIFLITLLFIRAINVPLTPDEAFSYFLYIEPGYFTSPEAQLDANNHFLNSVLSWLSTMVFGHHTLVIRLSSLLAFPLFFYANTGIAKQLPSKTLFWIGFFTLTSIYPFFEFFALSRGYGLSFAFMSLAIYHVFKYQKDHSPKRYIWLIIGLVGGMLSQLGLLFVFSGITVLIIVIYTLYAQKNYRSNLFFGLYTLVSVCSILLFVNHILFLNELDLLYYGDATNFPFFNSLTVMDITFHQSSALLSYLFLSFIAIICVAFIVAVYNHKMNYFSKAQSVFGFLLLTSLIAITFSVYVLKAPGPIDRTALYLLFLCLGGMLFFPTTTYHLNRFVQYSCLAIPCAFILVANSNKMYYWEQEAIDDEIYTYINNPNYTNYTIAGSRYLDRLFYASQLFNKHNPKIYHISTNSKTPANFLLLTQHDYTLFGDKENYSIRWNKREKGVLLLERKQHISTEKIQHNILNLESGNNAYLATNSFYMDTAQDKHLLLDVSLKLQIDGSGHDFLFTTSFFDKEGNSLENRYIALNTIKRKWTEKTTNFIVPVFEIPDSTSEIRNYIYNPKEKEYVGHTINYTYSRYIIQNY